jgi:hypothetical protein
MHPLGPVAAPLARTASDAGLGPALVEGAALSDDPVERLREHLEKRRDHAQVFVSVDGLQALFDQRDELKAQVERLLAKEAARIGEALAE